MTVAAETVAPGIYGAKRQSWRERNPRVLFEKLVLENPQASAGELRELYWNKVLEDDLTAWCRSFFDYSFDNMLGYHKRSMNARGGNGHSAYDTHQTSAIATACLQQAVSVSPERLKALAGRASLVTETLLIRYSVDGRPFAECLPPAVRDWAATRRTDARTASVEARWAELLIDGLRDDQTIGAQRTPRQAERLFTKATKEVGGA